MEYLHTDISKQVLGAAIEVHNTLGPGFLESVYEGALVSEFRRIQLLFQRQVEIPVWYKGDLVGTHKLDLLVAGNVIVELKAVKALDAVHTAIALSYLSATNLSVALVLNFARPRLEFKRIFRTRER